MGGETLSRQRSRLLRRAASQSASTKPIVDTLGDDRDFRHRWIETAHASEIPTCAIVFAAAVIRSLASGVRTSGTVLPMLEMTPTDIAHGGEAVARVDGKAHFVAGAIPGEVVAGEVVEDRRRWARVRLLDVIAASPQRVDPPCPAFGKCGGCTWQFAAYELQLEWKRNTVASQLAHLGRIVDPTVRATLAAPSQYGYRNRMDFAVRDGRPALHRARSNDLVPLDDCLLLHPRLAELFADLGDLRGVKRVSLRAGTRTGQRLIVVDGELPAQADRWDADVVRRRGASLQAVKGQPWLEEHVAGKLFRVPAGAFFQANTEAADSLVRLVGEALAVRTSDVLLDGYAGVGLFAATVGASARRVLAVESGKDAVAGCRFNLEALISGRFRVTRARFEDIGSADQDRWDVAVIDPPRAGLGEAGVTVVTGPSPRTIAYVSCDPAALARDAFLLRERGYEMDWAAPVDMFPQTFHIETVARFVRRA